MKIVVDINHPAHVHYFKNFIWEMEKRGHEILITASHKDVATELLQIYGFPFIDLGSYGSSPLEKMLNVPIMDIKMYRAVKDFNPDVLIGFSSIRAAHVSKLIGKPSIILDDTEHAKWEHRLYIPFADTILTPSSFHKNLGEKQIPFEGYLELAALHPKYFQPDPSVLDEFGLTVEDRFFVLRFISWDAGHDVGQTGIGDKIGLVKALEPYGRVLVTSEGFLPAKLQTYRIRVSPEKLHDLLFYATLYIGEGATTASECAMLGTHAIYVNSLGAGTISEQEKQYGLIRSISDSRKMGEDVVRTAIELLEDPDLEGKGHEKRVRLLSDKIDVTAFLVWFVRNYPRSIEELKGNPMVQKRLLTVPDEML